MLEMLLSIGAKATGGIYPNSGPGTKVLAFGDTTVGFFGEVTAAQIMDGTQAYQFAGLSAGAIDMPAGLVWLKFFLDGKVLFVAKQNVARALSWANLYNAGVVYGVRGPGTYPEATPMDQFKLFLAKEGATTWPLKMRLLRGYIADPTPAGSAAVGSEWDRLMYRIAALGNGGVAPWVQYTAAQLSTQSDLGAWVMETYNGLTTYAGYRGGSTTVASGSVAPKVNNNNWRPVFELLNANDVAIDPQALDYNADGLIPPSLIVVPNVETPEQLTNPILTDWAGGLLYSPALSTATEVTTPDIALAPVDVLYSIGPLKEIGICTNSVDTVPTQQYIWSVAAVEDFGFTTETI